MRDDDKRPPIRRTVHAESKRQTHIQKCLRKDTRGMRGKARGADKNDESRNRRDEKGGKRLMNKLLTKEKVHLYRSAKAERYGCFNIQWQQSIRRCLKKHYPICVITRCADTGRVPPARGVMVRAAAFPAGLRTVRTELTAVVVTIAIPTI